MKFLKNKKQVFTVVASVVCSVFLVAVGAYAVTTVGNDVSVGGTLTIGAAGSGLTVNSARDYLAEFTSASDTGAQAYDKNVGTMYVRHEIDAGSLLDSNSYVNASVHRMEIAGGNTDLSATNGPWVGAILGYLKNPSGTVDANSNVCSAINGLVNVGADWTQDAPAALYTAAFVAASYSNAGASINNYPAYLVVDLGAKEFTHGLYIEDDSCTTGIDIGSATTGIDFNGTFTGDVISVGDSTTPLTTATSGLNGIGVHYTYSKADGGSLTGINSTVEYIGTGTDYGSINGVTGMASIKTGATVGGTSAAYLSGTMGVIDISGTIDNSAAYLSGAAGVITGSGATTAANFITAGFFVNQAQKDMTSGIKSSLVLLRNDGLTASQLDTIWRIAAPDTDYFFVFEPGTAGGWWSAGGSDCTASGATDPLGTIKLKDANGTDAYIRVWAAK